MRSYEVARTLSSILGFVAWLVVAVGVLAALSGAQKSVGFGGNAGFMGAVPGIIISIIGLVLVSNVQTSRAGVDSAEYAQQMLKISRDQLEISQQALAKGNASPKSFSNLADKSKPSVKTASFPETVRAPEPAAQPTPEPVKLVEKQIKYQGHMIVSNGQTHRVDHAEFKQIAHAKEHIDLLLQKNALAAKVEELSAIKIPKLDPILSTREPVRLQSDTPENAPNTQRREPKF